jgi:hypothetical protein
MQSIESPINEYANEVTNGDTTDWETATRLPVIGVVKKSAVCAADVATSFRFFPRNVRFSDAESLQCKSSFTRRIFRIGNS